MKESEAIEWIKELRDSEEIREFYYAENFIKACDRAIQALENQVSKTSCDVDKIVEQLEEVKKRATELCLAINDGAQRLKYIEKEQAIALAIEIVKAGGKDEL